MPRLDPDTLGFLITDCARLIRAAMDREIAASGLQLTPGEARVLAHAARAGSVRQNELALRAGIDVMSVSEFLDALESKNLVRRDADPADRRAKLVSVTDAAGDVLERMGEAGSAVRAVTAKGFSEAEWDAVKAALKAVRANLTADVRQP